MKIVTKMMNKTNLKTVLANIYGIPWTDEMVDQFMDCNKASMTPDNDDVIGSMQRKNMGINEYRD